MLRVTVELLSARDGSRKVLGVAEICNDGTGTPQRGNYLAKFSRRGGHGVWKRVELANFPRQRLLAWDLLFCCLKGICEKRTQIQSTEVEV